MSSSPPDRFNELTELVRGSGRPFAIHEHAATRTIEDAARNLSFDIERIVKTIAFRTRGGETVLAALRGTRRVDYARLAALVGVNRRDLAPLSPVEVAERVGVEPGSVSPLMLRGEALLFVDGDVLTIVPTVYCGMGSSDRTLEMAPSDLLELSRGQLGDFSRCAP